MKIGFLASPEKPEETVPPTKNCMLCFDSGHGITFNDGVYHLILLGTTGAGKTASGFLPAVRHLLAAGHRGILVDVKGNLRKQVRALARKCGREKDIVEYGSEPTATRINILEGMDWDQLYSFFKQVTFETFHVNGNSVNIDWLLKGVSMTADCGQALIYLSRLDPMFKPNLVTINAMISQPDKARELYNLYKARVYDEEDDAQAKFVNSVENSRYHILKEIKREKGLAGDRAAAEDDQQMTWIMQGIRHTLKHLLAVPGISDNFAAPGGLPLDMRQMLKEDKVVTVRFGLNTGPTGTALARAILSRYYADVYELGLDLPAKKKTFVCIDEYQEVADLSADRFSDVSFISQAREFNAIFVASTQSMSALAHRSHSFAAVEAFTSNCNGRVVFYSDDPMTQAMVSRYDPSLDLKTLKSGEVFVVRYEHDTRQHMHGRESLQKEFESARDIIQEAKVKKSPARRAPAAGHPTLRKLIDWLKDHPFSQQENTGPHDGNVEDQRPFMPRRRRGESCDNVKSHIMEALFEQRQAETAKEISTKKETSMRTIQDPNGILKKFPHLFAADEDITISVPVGWLSFAENALTAFSASGLSIQLTSLSLNDNVLRASENASGEHRSRWGRSESGTLGFLNELLQASGGICALCGEDMASSAKMKEKSSYDDDDDDDDDDSCSHGTLPICHKCLQKYKLASLSCTTTSTK